MNKKAPAAWWIQATKQCSAKTLTVDACVYVIYHPHLVLYEVRDGVKGSALRDP